MQEKAYANLAWPQLTSHPNSEGSLLAITRRIFLDANVLVAIGFRPHGEYRPLLDLKLFDYVTSEHILSEVSENLTNLGKDPIEFIANLRRQMEITDQVMKLPAALPLDDDEDRQALDEAIGSRCEEFVTFNSRDFNALYGQTNCGVLIRHSADFRRLHLPTEG